MCAQLLKAGQKGNEERAARDGRQDVPSFSKAGALAKVVGGLWGRPVRGTESNSGEETHSGAVRSRACWGEANLGQARARHRLESDWDTCATTSK